MELLFFLGVVLVGVGTLQIRDPNLSWSMNAWLLRIRGIQRFRSPVWEQWNHIRGFINVTAGALAIAFSSWSIYETLAQRRLERIADHIFLECGPEYVLVTNSNDSVIELMVVEVDLHRSLTSRIVKRFDPADVLEPAPRSTLHNAKPLHWVELEPMGQIRIQAPTHDTTECRYPTGKPIDDLRHTRVCTGYSATFKLAGSAEKKITFCDWKIRSH